MKIKGILVAAALVALLPLASCVNLVSYRYWPRFAMTEPAVSTYKIFEDERIAIRFRFDEKKIHYHLQNRMTEPLVIDWGGALYIGVDGEATALANQESLLSEKRFAPPRVTVAPNGEVRDFAAPVANVEKLEDWTWYLKPLFDLENETARDLPGKMVGVDLPMIAGGERIVYQFRFTVSSVTPYQRFSL